MFSGKGEIGKLQKLRTEPEAFFNPMTEGQNKNKKKINRSL
jgi:hypothetical protein